MSTARLISCLSLVASLAFASCTQSSDGGGDNGGSGGDGGGGSSGGGGNAGGQGGNSGGGGSQGGSAGGGNPGTGGVKAGSGGGTAGAGGAAGTAGAAGMAGAAGSAGKAGSAGATPDAGAAGAAGQAGGTAGTGGASGTLGATFIAVGGGKTAVTTDGKVWTAYPDGMTPNNLEIVGACIGNGFILALNHMSNAGVKQGVWRGSNGHDFVRVYPEATKDGLPGEGCAYAGNIFTAGNNYSEDNGMTWKPSTSPNGVGNRGVAYGKGIFVGAGDSNLNWSADGKTWMNATIVGGGGVTGLSHVAFGGNKFLTVPYVNTNKAFESTDGKTWTETKTKLTPTNSTSVGAAVGKLFVTTSAGIYWLPDDSAPGASAWTKTTTNFDDGPIGGNATIAVSARHWSTNGDTWTTATTSIPAGFNPNKILQMK